MTIYLGIETSCDETGVAILEDEKIICEKLLSQEDIHAIYGGVVPEIASRNHLEAIPILFKETLKEASLSPEQIDVVCVARGPGLMGSLLVGLGFAKGLCLSLNTPLIGVNHLHAHLLACLIENRIEFPALGLLISGGHTQIYKILDPINFELLGKTLDDAVGEAFDKTAKLLNLPYPGGKYIDTLANLTTPDPKIFPLPYIDNDNLDFSFSGLKTAVLNFLNNHPEIRLKKMPTQLDIDQISKSSPFICKICSSFNHCVAKTLEIKLDRALKKIKEIKSILVAGGVAANSIIRKYLLQLGVKHSLPVYFPEKRFCTDNGVMIAYAGKILFENGYVHPLDIDAIPRGRTIPFDYSKKQELTINTCY
ncbi:tRNA (adenosine(37)-N6)-threonylcarbamoyltransferase complex transferase subunit TsaD [Desulfothermus naphthae]